LRSAVLNLYRRSEFCFVVRSNGFHHGTIAGPAEQHNGLSLTAGNPTAAVGRITLNKQHQQHRNKCGGSDHDDCWAIHILSNTI